MLCGYPNIIASRQVQQLTIRMRINVPLRNCPGSYAPQAIHYDTLLPFLIDGGPEIAESLNVSKAPAFLSLNFDSRI